MSLKPGGILALVTSRFTLDKQNAATREYLADRADFLGAIRLPSDRLQAGGHRCRHRHHRFSQTAKRSNSQTRRPGLAGDWHDSASTGADVRSTSYFLNHPEHGLGRPGAARTRFTPAASA